MDKFEYKIRSEEIKTLIAQREYVRGAELADTVDWRRVKSVMMLCTISDLYKINRRYEDARDMLLLAYDRYPGGRTIVYSLCELSVKMDEIVQAVEYYKEFVRVAPRDTGRYILQYKIYEAQEVSLEERIAVLEELKKKEYREKWAYELAYLYHRMGLKTRCVEECDELILWFGDGKYVTKAMELKMLHESLTDEQQMRYEGRFSEPVYSEYYEEQQEESEYGTEENSELAYQNESYPEGEYPNNVYAIDGYLKNQYTEEYDRADDYALQYSQENYNEEQYQGDNYTQEQYLGEEYPQEGYSESEYAAGEQYSESEYATGEQYSESDYATGEQYSESEYAAGEQYPESEYAAGEPYPGSEYAKEDEFDIKVKTMDVGQYNTINLQKELAKGLQEVLGNPDMPSYTPPEEMQHSEVFFGETDEILYNPEETIKTSPKVTQNTAELVMRELQKENQKEDLKEVTKEDVRESIKENVKEDLREEPKEDIKEDLKEVLKEEQEATENKKSSMKVVHPSDVPKELADVLAMEADGQISLVMPEIERIEKQITGQLSIEDILLEWERMKNSTVEKHQEERHQRLLRQTGSMFTEFEASLRDELLRELEEDQEENLGDQSEKPEDYEGLDDESELLELEQPVSDLEEIVLANDFDEEDETLEETAEEELGELEAEELGLGELETEELGLEELEGLEAEELEPEELEAEELELGELEAEELEPEELESKQYTDDVEESEFEPNILDEEDLEQDLSGSEEADSEHETKDIEESDSKANGNNKKESEGVPPSDAKVGTTNLRKLTREERELYSSFIQSKNDSDQLVKVIDEITLASYTGNVILTGEEGSNTLALAKTMVQEIKISDSNFSGKVARISAQTLNKKEVRALLDQMRNGALIIQKASQMEELTALDLNKGLQQESLGIIVFIEDTKKAMDKLLERCPSLTSSFTARMDIEVMCNDALVAYGKRYAKEKEYSIDELGILALHTRIGEMQTTDHAVTIADVKAILDEAIQRANRKTVGHFIDILLARRYDEEDMIILREDDFIYSGGRNGQGKGEDG
ncbi:hypothetical protein LJC58_02960 [Lachnospiraceae bacterium OttesenSCG-928-D06]|nr:hypothetical protein [Lachnospiraceae bacterium OttesenSCG-928-D06]